MAGVRQKPPELLANGRGGRGRGLTIVQPTARVVPKAPTNLCPEARKTWVNFWKSPVSLAVDMDADGYMVRRWIKRIDEKERLETSIAAGGLSDYQLMLVYARIKECDRIIEKSADAFGLTPLSRFRLQLTVTEAGISMESLRKAMVSDAPTGEIVDWDAIEAVN